MDPDSFLSLLSPDFDDLDVTWDSPVSDTDLFAMQPPGLAWLNDGFMNLDGGEEEDEEEDDEEDEGESEEAPLASKRPAVSTTSALSSSIVSNASSYSSVLKLSDIASALSNFSKATGVKASSSSAAPPQSQKLSPAQSLCATPHSPSPPDSSIAMHSPVQDACAFNKDMRDVHKLQPSRSSNALNRLNTVSASMGFRHGNRASAALKVQASDDVRQVMKRDGSINPRSDSMEAIENEPNSKLTSDGISGWESSDIDNEDDNEEEEDMAAEYEDIKPCVSHVRIIRRPNSNCGQGPSPKRAKFAHVKAEATSSTEKMSFQDDKDGESGLKQLKKEGMSQREVHILSERQRRKSMRESFTILQSLVPKLKPKHTDRITVLTEVITYIESLRGTLEELERKKADMMELLGLSAKSKSRRRDDEVQGTVTYVNSNNSGSSDEKEEKCGGGCTSKKGETVAIVEVTVRMCAADVFITLNTTYRRGVWSRVLALLQKFGIEVSNATLTTSGDSSFHCIHAKATNMASVEGVDLQEELEGVIVKELRRRSKKGLFTL